MHPLFQPPDDTSLSSLLDTFPCREPQIRSLTNLIAPTSAPCRNIVLHGTEATGKSAIVEALLRQLASPHAGSDRRSIGDNYAIMNSIQCITARHLFERTLNAVVDALGWHTRPRACETTAQLAVELSKMLKDGQSQPPHSRFVLVFDSIDRQREAPHTLLPALARLPELASGFLRTSFVPHIHFPNYSKPDYVKIMAPSIPAPVPNTTEDDMKFLWPRFCAAVHDALAVSASRTLPALRRACDILWPRFTAPVAAGTHGAREFSKLLIHARVHLQDESILNPSIIALRPTANAANAANTSSSTTATTTTTPSKGQTPTRTTAKAVPTQQTTPDLASLLPTTARLLLLAAYLASHNATRHDLALFSTYHHGRRKRRGGGFAAPRSGTGRGAKQQHRKIARKLLGAHAFVLERMLAIFAAVRADLRLLVRVGVSGDVTDRGGKWRINVGWDVIRGVGRSIGVEVEEWLID
ncbi:origin recognition complex subunit 5 C-terminus-domain-containing protein [Verticillium dahliae]|nr:origin recognition complex subunit 5 C-terminus-domain-containing protein [Verticillium dahliae]